MQAEPLHIRTQFAAIAVAEKASDRLPVTFRALPPRYAEPKQFSFDRREVGQIDLRFHVHRLIMQQSLLSRVLICRAQCV